MSVLFDDPVVTAFAAPCAGSLQVGMEIVDPVFGGRARRLVHVEEYRDPDRLGSEVWAFTYDGTGWAALIGPCESGPCCRRRRSRRRPRPVGSAYP